MLEKPIRRSGLCILAVVVIAAALLAGVSTAAAQSDPGFEIQYDEVYSSVTDNDSAYFESFIIETVGDSTFEIGPRSEHTVQVVNTQTDETVTLSVQNQISNIERLTIETQPNGLSDDPVVVSLAGGERTRIDSAVQGDVEMFQTETFSQYEVQIVNQSKNIVATTEPQIHGVGYKPDIEYNGSAIATSGNERLQEDWYVELRQNVSGNPTPEKILEASNQAGTDYFVASVEGSEFIENREFSIYIQKSESEHGGEGIVRAYRLEITDERRVDGPVGGRSTDDGSDGSRFDTNGEAGIQRGEVVDGIVAFNNDATVNDQEVTRGEIVDLIVAFNS
jgi:hypothetical protein